MSTGREEGFLWWGAQWAGTAKRAGPEIGTGEAVSIFGPFIDPLSLEPTDMLKSLPSRKIASLPSAMIGPVSYPS